MQTWHGRPGRGIDRCRGISHGHGINHGRDGRATLGHSGHPVNEGNMNLDLIWQTILPIGGAVLMYLLQHVFPMLRPRGPSPSPSPPPSPKQMPRRLIQLSCIP